RYDISDYRRVDPHLGGEAAWDELVLAAGEAGIRIVLDGVFNHGTTSATTAAWTRTWVGRPPGTSWCWRLARQASA
ncbi:alpha-glycosidase, partial [Methylobacterium radiotolerans]